MLGAMKASLLRRPAGLAALLVVFACGARTPPGDLLGLESSSPGQDSGVSDSALPGVDAGGPVPKACGTWMATHAAVQVSNTPSIEELMSVALVPGGVLVGYADAQLPQVDPNWHLRTVAFGDGALGPEQSVFRRDGSQLGWTRISTAGQHGVHLATASDEGGGMKVVPIDATGARAGTEVDTSGDPGRFIAPTPTGFSVLRSAFSDTGLMPAPVRLATLDDAGNVTGERTLIDSSVSLIGYSRSIRDDDSFLLWWFTDEMCTGCRTLRAQHYDPAGNSLGGSMVLHQFAATDYVAVDLAVSPVGTLAAWTERVGTTTQNMRAQAFDADGNKAGPRTTYATLQEENAPAFAIGSAPGNAYIAAWVDGVLTNSGHVSVQAVAADGSAGGPTTVLGTVSPSSDLNVEVVANAEGAMVLYESDIPNYGIEVYAIPLRCAE